MRISAGSLASVLLVGAAGCAPTTWQTTQGGVTPRQGPNAFAVRWPGQQTDGSVLLPNQWSLRPVGKQVELADFPVNVAVHPGGRYAAVLHAGYSQHEIIIVDLSAAQTASSVGINQAFYGLEFSPDGKTLFCSGAGEEVIHAFAFRDGQLSEHRELKLRDVNERGVPAGLAVDSTASRLYVANVWAHRISQVELLAEPKVSDIAIGTNVPPPARAPKSASSDFEIAAATKRAEALLYESNPADTFPYACRLDEKRRRLYISLWAQSSVAVLDLRSGQPVARWRTEEHPCEMVLTRSGKFLFVANASRNTVTVFDTQAGKPLELISASLYPGAPPGSTPNSVALSPDERTLYVANADNNVIAVFDISAPGKSHSLGF